MADPGFAKGGGRTMVNARSGGSTESFLYKKSQKKWPKVKDLSENLPPCLSRAAMASPKFWSMGGGGGGRPP